MAGALTGVLLVLSVAVAGRYLGASTTFARGAAVVQDSVGVATEGIDYYTIGEFGKITVPQVLGVNHWVFIAVFAAVVVLSFRLFEKRGL